jgi:hypothetical protein
VAIGLIRDLLTPIVPNNGNEYEMQAFGSSRWPKRIGRVDTLISKLVNDYGATLGNRLVQLLPDDSKVACFPPSPFKIAAILP